MRILTIRRFVPEYSEATLGVFLDGKLPFAWTYELPWKQNARMISCIPTGEYITERLFSKKFNDWLWHIKNVPNRDDILLHWGNYSKDTDGCILVGANFKDINGDGIIDIANSRTLPGEGYNALMERTQGLEDFKLVIEKASAWEI